MTLLEARDLLEYWQISPPAHLVLGILARAYTTWSPEQKSLERLSEAERRAAHMADLEQRWSSGQAMRPDQMWKAGGGNVSDGTLPGYGGIPFPGSPAFKRWEAEKAAAAAKSGA